MSGIFAGPDFGPWFNGERPTALPGADELRQRLARGAAAEKELEATRALVAYLLLEHHGGALDVPVECLRATTARLSLRTTAGAIELRAERAGQVIDLPTNREES